MVDPPPVYGLLGAQSDSTDPVMGDIFPLLSRLYREITDIHRSMKAFITALALIATLACTLAAPPKRGTIGATCMTTANPFFKVIEENMRAEAAKFGYDLVYLGCDNDVSKQQKQIQDFIVQKVTAIALNPADSKAIGSAVRAANKAGIPVFTFDVKCEAPDVEIVSHVGTDNAGGGELAGKAMIDALGEAGGKVVIIDYRSVESCQQRVKGFKKIIDAHNAARDKGKIEVVAELPGEGDRAKGFKAAEDALQVEPDLKGIFAINDPSGLGAVGALKKAGKLDGVAVIAFDGMPAGKQAIKAGDIFADPIQHPDKIGRQTIGAIIGYLSGEEPKPNIDIPATLYTKSEADKDPSLK
jgi:ribose transport system substrate-binding protein